MSFICKKSALSLVEILMALAVLSTLALPMGMLLVELNHGSNQIGDYYQILNLVEQKLEKALSMPYDFIPLGEVTDELFVNKDGLKLDLRPVDISGKTVRLYIITENLPADFTALQSVNSSQLQRARLEDAMKRIEIVAKWSERRERSLNLIAYKADL